MDLKYDRILNRLREEDAGSGSLPVGVRADYTAFEVVANNAAIPAGSTDVVIGGGTVSFGVTISGTTYGTAVEIPVGMTHQMELKTLDSAGITVNWGDGNTSTYTSSPDATITPGHTYTTPGKYTVKVYGRFSRIAHSSTNNLLYRLCSCDLPIAQEHVNLMTFARGALRLTNVAYNDQRSITELGNLNNMFSYCYNLRSVTGMWHILSALDCNSMFLNDVNMVKCDFRMPAACCLMGSHTNGGNYGFRQLFYESTDLSRDTKWLLSADLNDLFPDTGFVGTLVDLTALFYTWGEANVCTYEHISLTGTSADKLARKLWLDTSKKFIGFSGIFKKMPSAVRAYIPTAWGGTDTSVVVDTETGTVAEAPVFSLSAAASGATVVTPVPGCTYNISGDAQSLQVNDWDYTSAKQWEVNVGFASGAAAAVEFNLSHPHTTINTLDSDFSFEAGKKYCIRCRNNRLERHGVNEVRLLNYDLLSYLKSTGTQFINTGIALQPWHYCVVDLSENLVNDKDIFGSRCSSDTGYKGFNCVAVTETYYSGFYDNAQQHINALYDTADRHKVGVGLLNGQYLMTVDGTVIGTFADPGTWGSASAGYEALLFSSNINLGHPRTASAKVYGLTIYDGRTGSKVQELVPARWLANCPYIDGNTGQTITPSAAKPGMIDLVTKKFFVNQDSGDDFEVGV